MIMDLASDHLPEALQCEFCVIGAGPAGMTLALHLARHGRDVALIESGGEEIETEVQSLNISEVVGRPHTGVQNGRFRALGGTSQRWGGQVLPLFAIDFAVRPWVAGSGWPIGLEELEPYLRQALIVEGLEQCLSEDSEVWRVLGLSSPQFGSEVIGFLTRWCPEPNFARVYRQELRQLPNLRCALHATVTKITASQDQIQTVRATNYQNNVLDVGAKKFIFCAGAIETTRLLLHPLANGTAPPWVVKSQHLGACFQDHPGITCAKIVARDVPRLHRLFDQILLRGHKYQPRFMISPAHQAETRTLNVGGTIIAESRHAETLASLKSSARSLLQGCYSLDVAEDLARAMTRAAPHIGRWLWRAAVNHRGYAPADLGLRLGAQVEQPPRLDSRVSLSQEIDRLGMRRAKLDWRLGQEEVDAIATFAATVKSALESDGIADVHIDADVAARSPEVLGRVVDQNHHMGTVRMAATAADGVVDANLRMFGAENGYVCSSAVFPTSSFSNPTHTIIALAIRLAEHLEGYRWQ